jgi:hypothetical protein
VEDPDARSILELRALRKELWKGVDASAHLPPDTLQLAAAVSGWCSAHLTNDRSLPRIPGLEILQLKDYAASA